MAGDLYEEIIELFNTRAGRLPRAEYRDLAEQLSSHFDAILDCIREEEAEEERSNEDDG